MVEPMIIVETAVPITPVPEPLIGPTGKADVLAFWKGTELPDTGATGNAELGAVGALYMEGVMVTGTTIVVFRDADCEPLIGATGNPDDATVKVVEFSELTGAAELAVGSSEALIGATGKPEDAPVEVVQFSELIGAAELAVGNSEALIGATGNPEDAIVEVVQFSESTGEAELAVPENWTGLTIKADVAVSDGTEINVVFGRTTGPGATEIGETIETDVVVRLSVQVEVYASETA